MSVMLTGFILVIAVVALRLALDGPGALRK